MHLSSSHNSYEEGKIGEGMACEGKREWPELLGVDGEEAAAIIVRENPRVEAIIVKPGNSVITDYRCDRVWVWVDEDGKVKEAPHIG